MPLPKYFIVAGNVHVAKLDANSLPLDFLDLGEVPQVEWNATVEYADNRSTGLAGPNLMDMHAAIYLSATLRALLKERQLASLEHILGGTKTTDAAASYTANEAFPSGIVNGQTYRIPGDHVGASNPVVKDGAGSPVTVPTTKYSISANGTLITFLDVAGYTQPFTMFSYDYLLSTKLTLLEKAPPELCVIVEGKNLAPGGEKIFARIDRVAFAPATQFDLKTGSEGGTGTAADTYELAGPALIVPGRTSYGEYRQF